MGPMHPHEQWRSNSQMAAHLNCPCWRDETRPKWRLNLQSAWIGWINEPDLMTLRIIEENEDNTVRRLSL